MNTEWRSALRRIIIISGLTIVIGLTFDILPWALSCVFAVYAAWQLRQMRKLQLWLNSESTGEPPNSRGLWGSILDDVHRLQKRHSKAQTRLKAVINRVQDSTAALKDGVLMVDSHGNLEWWNKAAGNLLGLKDLYDIGQPISNLVRDPFFKAYLDNSDYDEPLEMGSPQNPQLILQLQITLFGRKDRLIVVRNISQIKQLENMRQDFVANASHELRTPLTVISGYLETFADNKEMLPNRWGKAVDQMYNQSQRMQNLVSDLLLLSQLETSASQDSAEIAVPELLKSIRQDALAFGAEKNQEIRLEAEHTNLLGLDTEIASAFSNLIFNAVKYTQSQGKIVIHWWSDKTGVFMSVSDNGMGIDSRHIPRLTERFYRADASRHLETGGTGLGLAIVKHVLIRHQGRLEITSQIGKGSTFTCYFPIDRKVELLIENTNVVA